LALGQRAARKIAATTEFVFNLSTALRKLVYQAAASFVFITDLVMNASSISEHFVVALAVSSS
jgi:hypothetical protein